MDYSESANAHLEFSADKSQKKSSGNIRLSGARKIESVHQSLDNVRNAIDLLSNLTSFLEATTNDSNKSLNNVAKEACAACVGILEGHVNTVSNLVDNTKETRSSKQAHNKLTKQKRREAQHAKLEIDRAIKNNPKKALVAAIKTAQTSVQHDAEKSTTITALVGEKRKSNDSNYSSALASLPPRQGKERKMTEEKKSQKLPVPRVPRPQNSASMYHPYELKEALKGLETNIEELSGTKNKNLQRSFKKLFKQEIINKGYVPIQISAMNNFALKYVEKDANPPLYWNQKGGRDLLSVDDLYAKRQEKRDGEWSRDDTKAAVYQAKMARATEGGNDPHQVTMPDEKTVNAYHSALMSMVLVREREPPNCNQGHFREIGEM